MKKTSEEEFDTTADEELEPSKSALKRHMVTLRKLADQLSSLRETDLLSLNLPDNLLESIQTAARLKSSNARNRQLRHAGKILEKSDDDVLENINAHFISKQRASEAFNRKHQDIESWRDRLLDEPKIGLEALIERFPNIDRQEIRALSRQANKERQQGKTLTQQRKLFRYLRDKVFI